MTTITDEQVEAACKAAAKAEGFLVWPDDCSDEEQATARKIIIAALEAYDAAAWQNIESAPKDGTVVDLWCRAYTGKSARVPDMWWTDRTGWRSGKRDPWAESMAKGAAYWRPMPTPPAKGDE